MPDRQRSAVPITRARR